MRVALNSKPKIVQRVLDQDQALVKRAQNGDCQALGELFVRHERSVRRLLISVIGPVSQIDDLAQDVFLRVHKSLNSFRGEARFSTWLHKLTVYTAYSYLRKPRRNVPTEPTELDRSVEDNKPGAQDLLLQKELVAKMYTLLDSVSPKRRVAFTLFVIEGYSIAQVAQMTGITAPAAKSRIWFARREIQKKARQDEYLSALIHEMNDGTFE